MALNRPRRAQRGQQAATQPIPIPAPIAGINGTDSLASMGVHDSIYSYNVIPNENGLQTRNGYREWCTTLGGATNPVCTMIPFAGQDGTNKLFCTTKLGIYDVTSSAASPVIKLAFGTQTGNAGYGVSVQYNNDGGEYYILYADTLNGLFFYTPGTDTWAQVTGITGVNETALVFVVEHKERLWFIEKDTQNAWYTAAGAMAGAATKFNLGPVMPRGGSLRGIYRWSVDGGSGLDDLLVFVSSSGDVAVFSGDDPASSTTWRSIGIWTIGKVPNSKTIAENIGGELHLLSVYGLLSMQDLVSGVEIAKITGQNSLAKKISRYVKADMIGKSDDPQWDVTSLLSQGIVLVTRPYDTNETPIQYVFSFNTAGWGFWRETPINCIVEWEGAVYFGDGAGNVHYLTGSLDGVLRAGTGGTNVEFSFLTAYTDFGLPGVIKRPHFVRPHFLSDAGSTPGYSTKFLYDYDIGEPTLTISTVVESGALWDVATWDSSVWGGLDGASTRWVGVNGQGHRVALAVRGEAAERCTYIEAVVYSEAGGFML